jgi:membrane protein required for colicin V production
MNYLDIILAVPLLWAVYRGFTKGFIIEVASLIAIVLGIYGAVHFSYFISDALKLKSEYASLISFAVTFLIIVVIVFLLAKMLEKSVNLLALGLVNKLAGAFFGMLKVAFIISVVLILINKIDSKTGIIPEKTKQGSLLFVPVSSIAPFVIPKLNFKEIQMLTDSARMKKKVDSVGVKKKSH